MNVPYPFFSYFKREDTFIGREEELSRLNELFYSGRSSLVVIKGRRRIGKSRLVLEFANNYRYFSFSALAPPVSTQAQLNHFALQLAKYTGEKPPTFSCWMQAFYALEVLCNLPVILFFDEISWMEAGDETFLSQLKSWWDRWRQTCPHCLLILSGSVSTWIDRDLLQSSAFFGRISLYLELKELPIFEAKRFLRERGFQGSEVELFQILCVVGGIPGYLEMIQPHITADSNIKRLCFEREGLLFAEFNHLFRDLFLSRGDLYKSILSALKMGMKTKTELQKELKVGRTTLQAHLYDLEVAGMISCHPQWSLHTHKVLRKALYRLSDPYLRFYLHYIEPNRVKIEQGAFSDTPLRSLPGIDSMLGFQMETLLLKNRFLLYKALGLYPQEIVMDNPYQQRALGKKKGCQIDYLVQTHANTLFFSEVKMRGRPLGKEVIDSMRAKINAFQVPKGFTVCPVLFHLGPASKALLEARYFYRVVDISQL